jgi:uncharacterized membrane protein YbhN (UPF0104 family)
MLAPDQAVSEFALPTLDIRALARRAALPALLTAMAVALVAVAGGRIHAFADAFRHVLDLSPGWVAAAIVFECISVAGYIGLLSLVAGRATPRVGMRESLQITLAGAAATRLLPTAGAGGAALTLWTLRRAGLRPIMAARTLLAFLVVLYSVFLASIVVSGAVLGLGLVGSNGPQPLSFIPSVASLLAIGLAVALGFRPAADVEADAEDDPRRQSRLRAGAALIGHAVRDALQVVRSRDPRLAGAISYWLFDAAVLWAMLRAFGSPTAIPVVALAYLAGQVANTLPLPGTVSGGTAAALIVFGTPPELALPAVLAYRAVSVWLPSPTAIAVIPGLRATIARWAREDSSAPEEQSAAVAPVAGTAATSRRRPQRLSPVSGMPARCASLSISSRSGHSPSRAVIAWACSSSAANAMAAPSGAANSACACRNSA